MVAVNIEQTKIIDSIFMKLMAKDEQGINRTANVMICVSPCTNDFYLSRDACIKMGIINRDFPRIITEHWVRF